MNKKKQAGMILLTTFLMLGTITLLIISQMQLILLFDKAINQNKEEHQSFYQFETAINQIMKHGMQPNCTIEEQDPNVVIDLLTKKRGCSIVQNTQQFFYLIERLGLFACLQRKMNDVLYSTEHFRISLMNARKFNVMQIRIAQLAPLAACENQVSRRISGGIISWRFLKN